MSDDVVFDLIVVGDDTSTIANHLHATADRPFRLWTQPVERGWARAVNDAAKLGAAPYIGLLDPGVEIGGPFLAAVENLFARIPTLGVTGCRFGVPLDRSLGVHDWVCGAAFFARRAVWGPLGGFDEGYRGRAYADTDFIRRLQADPHLKAVRTVSIDLPLEFDLDDVAPLDDAMRYLHKHGNAA